MQKEVENVIFYLQKYQRYDKINLLLMTGGLAQLARAPALHAGGQGFESLILHQLDY